MNEDLILSMAKPYVEDSSITYEQFDSIYDMLSLREQYAVSEILHRNGISLVDGAEQVEGDSYLLETEEQMEEDAEEFQVLYDEGLFQDGNGSDKNYNLVINRAIKQSNEILCTLIQQGNRQAEQDLCVKNKKLVDKLASAYQKRYGNKVDFEDLEQVGFIGLIKAARKFEIQQGYAFSTYAVWWIKQSISREIMENGYAIRIPVHMVEKVSKVAKAESLYMGLSRNERMKKISEKLSMTEKAVKECLILRRNYLGYVSLDAPIGDEEDVQLGDRVLEEDAPSVEDIIIEKELRTNLENAISTLTTREQMVLRLRYGLDDGEARTLGEVGEWFNVSPERIRQVVGKALRKLRHPSTSKKLKDFLNK